MHPFPILLAALLAPQASAPKAPDARAGWEILTPPAPATPRINGPSLFGVRPGSPVRYTIPATGQRPIEFSVDRLPAGLRVDSATGIVSGKLKRKGEYAMTLRAKNALGVSERRFRLVVGDRIALTPPMGWSSWNCWGAAVSQDKVLASARAMVEKGLRDHGWTYVNVDDGWQSKRSGPLLAIQPNAKFPDMKALADDLHGLGLKFGIYSTPWRGSYAGFVGGSGDRKDGTYDWIEAGDHTDVYQIGKDQKNSDSKKWGNWTFGKFAFDERDVAQWALWGVDYLKYDWFPNDGPHVESMARALRKSGRDVVYSLSNTALYDSADLYARTANVWRTTGDINDSWGSVAGHGFSQDRWASFNGPGHWNDPDMLVVGKVGWGPQLHPSRLTADEQYTHISLWCLLASPLLLGCDLAQLDDFTVGLLTNDEVLAVDQDPLGKQATQIANDGERIVYAKTLEDGSIAVGLFNRGAAEATVSVNWGPWGSLASAYGGRYVVRDLWRQKDLGEFNGRFSAKVASHGVVLVRLIRPEGPHGTP